jgi:hypothetical protein
MTLTESQNNELKRLQLSFPFRIVYGAFNPSTSEWFASAVQSMRIPNKLAREGWRVVIMERVK